MRNKKQPIPMVRIIRDVRDASCDYYLPRTEAEELVRKGKLIECSVYKDTWSYCHK